jgi:hypothetical protein
MCSEQRGVLQETLFLQVTLSRRDNGCAGGSDEASVSDICPAVLSVAGEYSCPHFVVQL